MKTLLILSFILFPFADMNSHSDKDAAYEKPEIIYVGDALCSWCYGFSPEITVIKNYYGSVADFKLVNGGLRPGTEKPMDAAMKKSLSLHWKEVNKRSGQPFKYDLLAPETIFIYDTEPPARAVVTVRNIKPESEFEFFKAVQDAFYAKNKNTNEVQTYIDLLPAYGIDKEVFLKLYNSELMINKTKEDFQLSDKLGVEGFPYVFLRKGNNYTLITNGYTKSGDMIKKLNKQLVINN
jgi:putative protein-disulfide isomerase